MMWYTHAAFGFLLGLMFFPWFGHTIIFVSLVVFGSLLPDIDHGDSKINKILPVTKWLTKLFRHRGFFHSLFPAAFIYAVFYSIGEWVGFALALGYVSHLLLDGFTKMGVDLLYPAATLRVQGFMETGSVGELVLFGVIAILSALKFSTFL